jgi:WD40 repeat protein
MGNICVLPEPIRAQDINPNERKKWGNIFSRTGPRQILLPTIKEAEQAEELFIIGLDRVKQWSVSRGLYTKDYGGIMAGGIISMAQISDKNYLFFAGQMGR